MLAMALSQQNKPVRPSGMPADETNQKTQKVRALVGIPLRPAFSHGYTSF
jgi:hypothetical protein